MLDQTAVRWVLLHLLNGDGFYLAMGLIALAGFARWLIVTPSKRTRIAGRLSFAIGLVLLLITASSLNVAWAGFLLALLVFAVAPARFRGHRLGHLAGFAALAGMAIYVGEFVAAVVPADSPRSIVVYGDSLSAPYGRDPTKTWPAIIAHRLGRPVDNRAATGAGVNDALDVESGDPVHHSTVIILLGGNDQLAGTPALNYWKDLDELIGTLVRNGNRVVVIETPVVPTRPWFGWLQGSAADRDGVTFVRKRLLADAIFGGPDRTRDGLHLSEAGHAALARRIGDLLANDPQTTTRAVGTHPTCDLVIRARSF